MFKKLSFILPFVISLLLLPSWAFAVDNDVTRASLRGIDGIRVVVEYLSPEIAKEGLNTDQIQGDVIQQLGAAGIKVLSDEKMPFLMVSPYIVKSGRKDYLYSIKAEFYQMVVPYRFIAEKAEKEKEGTPSVAQSALFGTTWASPGSMGLTQNLNEIRGYVKDEIAKFIEAFKSAGSK